MRDQPSIAPPRASIAPSSLPPPPKRAEPAVSTAPKAQGAIVLTASIVLACVADFATAIRPWSSTALTVALTVLVVPWAFKVLRARGRALVFHLANALLVAAFTTAKWFVLVDALHARPASFATAYRNYVAALAALFLVGIALRGGRIAALVASSAERPARLMLGSFGLTALVGALLLSLPVSMHDVGDVSLVDSFFMSTSAVCVTGLATVNVADTYTFTGQVILCALMQLGGLGIMVLTAAVTMLAGRRIGVKNAAVLAEMVDASSLADLRRTVSMMVSYTLVFEAAGAALLYVQLKDYPADSFRYYSESGLGGADSAAWAAIFHSVSAFCNGSLSNFRDGIVPFAHVPAFCQSLSLLIVIGGLGFPVIHELLFRWTDRFRGHRPMRLTLNTRVSLAMTAGMLLVVAVLTFALESGASFAPLGWGDRLNAALFHSACSRTSGFNVVDVGRMRPATLLMTSFAMFIGGGPGSTSGGIKITTFAVLFAAFRGELRRKSATLFDRSIPDAVVRRAMGVAFLATALVVFVVFVLLLTEDQKPLEIVFETVSAFSTTGFSAGVTPHLSTFGKVLISATMLVGRIGPLTAALAFADAARTEHHTLPQERVMIG